MRMRFSSRRSSEAEVMDTSDDKENTPFTEFTQRHEY